MVPSLRPLILEDLKSFYGKQKVYDVVIFRATPNTTYKAITARSFQFYNVEILERKEPYRGDLEEYMLEMKLPYKVGEYELGVFIPEFIWKGNLLWYADIDIPGWASLFFLSNKFLVLADRHTHEVLSIRVGYFDRKPLDSFVRWYLREIILLKGLYP